MAKKSAILILVLALAALTQIFASAYESLAYLYGGSTSTYLNRLALTGDNITMVAPDYFEVGADGGLVYTKAVDPLLLASMRDKKITVIPFLSNHWNRDNARKMLARRAQMATELAAAVVSHNLDGLDIDIQNTTEADKDDFTDFIKLLRAAMPASKKLTVCVPANPYYTTVGWQGAYDYAALAKHCDHVFIMTYDESYNGGPPGPVASYWFIENSIKYGLQYVPKEKLMIGLPLYGRYWTDTVKGGAFTCADIKWLAENTDATVWYDDKKDCARATLTIPKGGSVTTWGGKVLKEGVYDIWYENDRSYEKKLGLVRLYGLRGVGMWALGQEPSGMWGKYAMWLHGLVFNDIRDHWAQSFIVDLKNRGVISGKTDTRFEPQGLLTRAEAAVLLTRLAGISTNRGTPFADTATHWARDYIAAARDVQLVTGVTESSFQPDRFVTREEFAVMADRYTSLDDTFDMTESVFTDVSPEKNPWSIKSIVKMSIRDVVSGYPDGTFRPGENITRAETAKMLSLVLGLPTRFLSTGILPLNRAPLSPR